jgi:predicted TIM-barrel fold metal-dependent hydrolase
MLGAVLPPTGEGFKGHYGSRIYWPLYEEAESLGCALAIRGGSHVGLGMDSLGTDYPVEALGHQFSVMIQAFALMSSGVFDRFPTLRWGFLEGGAGWVPLFLDRIDRKFESNSIPRNLEGEWFAGPRPGEKASDYLKEHIRDGRIFVGFDVGEAGLGYAIDRAGRDAFLFASSFPRHDAATSRREVDALLGREDLRPQDKEALLAGNAERFYGQALLG